jgi:molybdopterin-guanine dinucleotide biosynthesis protein A
MTGHAALVLAGGHATRMGGGDKPLLELGGKSMLARILDRISIDTTHIAISANGDPARFAGFGYPVLHDGEFMNQGPLAGVLAGLDWAAGLSIGTLLTVPGDTPFIPAGLAGSLFPAPACAASAGQLHTLVALWPISVRDQLRALLSVAGPRSVEKFATSVGMRMVEFPAGAADPFMNLNDRTQLEAARMLVQDTVIQDREPQ